MTDAAMPTQRLFLAIWPSDAVRQALQQAQSRWAWPPSARPTPAARLHLTLVFLGQVDAASRGRLEASLDAAPPSAPPCMTFGQHRRWPGGLAVLEPLSVPGELAQLQARLQQAAQAAGIAVDMRKYRPHVTLARRALEALPPALQPPFDWTADRFVLVLSDRGYHPLAAWAATGRVAPA